MNFKSSIAAIFIVIASGSAYAQSAAPAPSATPAPAQSPVDPAAREAAVAKFRQACGADVQKFCQTAEKGRGAMRACLESHATELSDSCKSARAERSATKM